MMEPELAKSYCGTSKKPLATYQLRLKCVSFYIFWRNSFKFGLEHSQGIKSNLKMRLLIPVVILRISQVEAEIPDVKIFSDSSQNIFCPGADVKNLVFRSDSMPLRMPSPKFEAIHPEDLKGDIFCCKRQVTRNLKFLNCQ